MDIPVNQTIFWDKYKFESATEKTSGSCLFRGTTGQLFSFYSTIAGEYKINAKYASEYRQIAEGKVRANKMLLLDIKFYCPDVQVKFKPDAIGAVLTATVHGYPAVVIRNKQGGVFS